MLKLRRYWPWKPHRATLILFFNVLTFILKSEGSDVEHFEITEHMYWIK